MEAVQHTELERVDDPIEQTLERLNALERMKVWPNGSRDLCADAFGLVLTVSLYNETKDPTLLDRATRIVAHAERILGRSVGLRMGDGPDQAGQSFHCLAMWAFALWRLSLIRPEYHTRALRLMRQTHPRFVVPHVGVYGRMSEDLSECHPEHGFGVVDAYLGYVVYRLLDFSALVIEISELKGLIDRLAPDLGRAGNAELGMMLWLTHFFPDEIWSRDVRERALQALDARWDEHTGCYRERHAQENRVAAIDHPANGAPGEAAGNYLIALGLLSSGQRLARVDRIIDRFELAAADGAACDALTGVLECVANFPGELLAMPERI